MILKEQLKIVNLALQIGKKYEKHENLYLYHIISQQKAK